MQTQKFIKKGLKSNMDRFIGKGTENEETADTGLKSNMDRFIVILTPSLVGEKVGLKSNMDRFIGSQRGKP